VLKDAGASDNYILGLKLKEEKWKNHAHWN
jgi:hypothetical protein